jgi:hypothetical protein
MQSRTLYSVCMLAVLMWGCPKRQTAPRLVYVPSPPPAAEPTPSTSAGSIIIQEPAPQEPPPPVIVEEEAAPEEKPAPHRPRRTSTGRTEAGQEDTVTPGPPEVPALEPRESAAQQSAQRQQIIEMLAGIRGRVAQFKRDRLGDVERKTLDDAQMFLEQSQRALDTNDLVRALNLARKASLLANALH